MKTFVVIILSLISNLALACSCISAEEPRSSTVFRHFENAGIVVLARLDSETENVHERETRIAGITVTETLQEALFTTLQIFKGEIDAEFSTNMVSDFASCSYYFRTTGEYILYFNTLKSASSYRTSSCQGTTPLEENASDLEILDRLAHNN